MALFPASSDGDSDGGVRATLAESVDGEADVVRCTACAHRCRLDPGQQGICNVRENEGGELRLRTYGQVYAAPHGPPGTPDPVEKKPLYHFKPGSQVCSFGGASCNFSCDFCQNNHLSFSTPEDLSLREVSPEDAAAAAIEQGCQGVAWTYNEPTIYAEYVRDSARAAHEKGLYTAIVTNGYFTENFVGELAPHLDAANIDIKGFRERPHVRVMGGKLEPTLAGTELLLDRDVHVELTYLTIPDLNDDPEEIRAFAEWAHDLDPELPVHFTQFHPDHEMRDRPTTPVETLERAHDIATDVGLDFVYVGNVPGHEQNSTNCPDCGQPWIRRRGFETAVQTDLDSPCQCGRPIPITT